MELPPDFDDADIDYPAETCELYLKACRKIMEIIHHDHIETWN